MIQDNAASPVAQGDRRMLKLLLHWILSAIALLIVSRLVPGFVVLGIGPALIAALVIGLLNATLGFLLKIITFPLTILSLGLFLLVINGLMILVASGLVPGFKVYGMVPAFWGAVVLAILGVLFRYILKDSKDQPRLRTRSR
jgi:putative membrane protein